ncbi:MAG TPA: alpha/beta hydrolase [Streptosporangiaceae bacterium]|nr:alpha/beta hydrolase [Streptosporangiaceae bacterium]
MARIGGSAVYIDGPWSHRHVTANGTRFHIAEAGDGPLVLMLHGFPQFWWMWRQQLASLPAAGFRAVAADLRGFGGSDKPPRGYDLITAASDMAGLIRALGEANAAVVGHDWGGLVAWTMSAYFPKALRRLAVVSCAHPLRMRALTLTSPARQGWRGGYELGFQVPIAPERRLVADGAAQVGRFLHTWSGSGWPDPETERRYRAAMCIPPVAHTALEYHRWFFRSALRPDGMRYARRMRAPVQVPTLQIHGALDTCVRPVSAHNAARYVDGPYRWRLVDGAGHFVPEEQPEQFDKTLLGWLTDPEPER